MFFFFFLIIFYDFSPLYILDILSDFHILMETIHVEFIIASI